MTITRQAAAAFSVASNLNSLANAAAKPLGEVNNNTTPRNNYLLNLDITLNAAGVAATGSVELWYIESDTTGTDYSDGIAPGTTSDVAASLKNARLIAVLTANANAQVVRWRASLWDRGVFEIGPFWALVVVNKSGAAIAASGNAATYQAVDYS
jgi:hypothetical protein